MLLVFQFLKLFFSKFYTKNIYSTFSLIYYLFEIYLSTPACITIFLSHPIFIINYFLRKWIKDSYEFYDDIRKSDYASYAGVTDISGYIFANSSPYTVQVKID